jgi:outer membrane receptor for ferrienterochelin and colicins
MDFNLFRNDVNNLIEYQVVALTTSNQNIYSYRNIKRAVMQGLEANLVFAYNHKFSSSVGYQLLFAKDKNVDESIDKGEIFWRDPVTLVTQRLKSSEYFGLYNRSRHLGNFKVMYHDKEKGIEGSVRVIYRGKFGLGGIDGNIQGETVPPSDRNGNGIQDSYDSFVKGYALVNVSLAKQLRQLRVQGGIDNLFNYTDPVNISNLQGRILYLSLNVKFVKSTNN